MNSFTEAVEIVVFGIGALIVGMIMLFAVVYALFYLFGGLYRLIMFVSGRLKKKLIAEDQEKPLEDLPPEEQLKDPCYLHRGEDEGGGWMKCIASQSKSEGIKIREQAVSAATRFMWVATASVLTDKYGFGKQKIHQVMKSIEDRADSINRGYISLDELEEILDEEYDIRLSD